MKAKDTVHMKDPIQCEKHKHYSMSLAEHLLEMPEYELRAFIEQCHTANWEMDLEDFLTHMYKSPAAARMRLLFGKLVENSCCPQSLICGVISAIILFRAEKLLGKDANTTLQ